MKMRLSLLCLSRPSVITNLFWFDCSQVLSLTRAIRNATLHPGVWPQTLWSGDACHWLWCKLLLIINLSWAEGYSNHPVSVCICLSVCVVTWSRRLQDFAIQTSFWWVERDVKSQNYEDFFVKTYCWEDMVVLMSSSFAVLSCWQVQKDDEN